MDNFSIIISWIMYDDVGGRGWVFQRLLMKLFAQFYNLHFQADAI